MTAPISSVATWRLSATRAEFQLDSWSGSVDLAHPERGVAVQERATIRPHGAHVLGVEVDQSGTTLGTPIDAYVREADLVARYAESKSFPFGVQTYWSLARREISGASALQIDLLISIQTSQLDVRARVGSRSKVAAAAAWYVASANAATSPTNAVSIPTGTSGLRDGLPAMWILSALTPPDGHAAAGSYLEATPPTDFLGADLDSVDGALAVRRQLLDEIMEKGVIRRLACRGIFVRGPIEPEVAHGLYQELIHEKPRLTT